MKTLKKKGFIAYETQAGLAIGKPNKVGNVKPICEVRNDPDGVPRIINYNTTGNTRSLEYNGVVALTTERGITIVVERPDGTAMEFYEVYKDENGDPHISMPTPEEYQNPQKFAELLKSLDD